LIDTPIGGDIDVMVWFLWS